MTVRTALQTWINDADSVRYLRFLSIAQTPIEFADVTSRPADLYISLVGELFASIDISATSRDDWAQLGNAFLQFAAETSDQNLKQLGIAKEEAVLFAAASFYFGDYPASACMTMRRGVRPVDSQNSYSGCYDFMARPVQMHSLVAARVQDSIRRGDRQLLEQLIANSRVAEQAALREGPKEWIGAKLMSRLLAGIRHTNLRDVLPDGYSEFWTPFIESLVNRSPSTWEFFPSQIEAIRKGLLTSDESFSLQMPTGAGKTTLCEALLYDYLKSHPGDVAIMLVPFRSLASELRGTLVKQLNSLGIAASCAYGGTVPVGEELHGLANVQAVIATPESLSGLLGADPQFAQRIGLIICDEGHLLDGGGRGIGLELLLARMRARTTRSTRFVFISAIIPNISEINTWLGGNDDTVVKSNYRPAIAEFAVLKPVGRGAAMGISLDMHPHEPEQKQFSIDGFLGRKNFLYRNPVSDRQNTYNFSSIKTHAIAAARQVLSMGSVAIFAANKRGAQGAIGIAESLLEQLSVSLPLPRPIDFGVKEHLPDTVAYLSVEYGMDWIGARCVAEGIVLHHGDIPQETREVLETLIRDQDVKLVICTSTLAEGVNLPIRTLVLYSVQRRGGGGQIQNMLARDIKNLVGRAGRAGTNTKGLVICANPEQWQFVKPVALQAGGEDVKGSLAKLITDLPLLLYNRQTTLNNTFLEQNVDIHPLVDGVDATLLELLSDEIGEVEFVQLAEELATHTFAARQLPQAAAANLRAIFALRADRLIVYRTYGKTAWARTTGAKIRLIDSVEQGLLPMRSDWDREVDPLADDVRNDILQWAWSHTELKTDLRSCFRLDDGVDVETVKKTFFEIVRLWMGGIRFREIAVQVGLTVDDVLAIHMRGVTFSLQTLVEQGLSLLAKHLESDGVELAEGFVSFPEYLRFGAPNAAVRVLASKGVRHRTACVLLGTALADNDLAGSPDVVLRNAAVSLDRYPEQWRTALGHLVYKHTVKDLANR
jgi:helicase